MRRLALAALLLGSCASVSMGRKFTEDDLGQLRAGMTREEVRAILGPPGYVMQMPDGTEQWSYTWVRSHGTSVLFATNVESESGSHVIQFRDGRLLLPEPASQPAAATRPAR